MKSDPRKLLEAIPFGIQYWELGQGESLSLVGANSIADSLLHIDHAKLAGEPVQKILTSVNAKFIDALRHVASRGGTYHAEDIHLRKGEPGELYEVFAAQTGRDHVAVLFRDVARGLGALHPESETSYRDLVNEISDGIFITDEKGVLTFVNRPLAAMYGSDPRESFVGRHLLEFVAAEFRDRAWEAFQHGVAMREKLQGFETALMRQDGSQFMAEINAIPQIRGGRVIGTRGVIRDISSRKQSEEALRESEERYRSLVELSPDAIAVHAEGKVVFANTRALKLLGGVGLEDVVGKPILDFVHPDSRDVVRVRVHEMVTKGLQVPPIEEKFVSGDGTVVEVEVAAMPFRHQNKPAVLVVMRDISARRKAEELLKKLFSAVEQSGEVIFMTDPDGTITYVNPAFEAVYGFTADEAIGQTPRILKSGLRDEIGYEKFWNTILGGQTVREEFVNKTKSGRLITINASVSPIFASTGSLAGFIAVQQDITREKVMEEKLRQSEEQYRLITENVADLIAVLDIDGRRLYNSPSYRNLIGEPELLRGTDSFEEVHPDDRERIRLVFWETVRSGVGQRSEYRLIGKDGSVRNIESQGSVIKDARGKVAQVVVVSRDVTEKKVLQQQFLRAQRMESIGTLAAGIAHDLNNVLSPIMLSIDLLRAKVKEPEIDRLLNSIAASAKRGSDIVKQVLTFGRGVEGERIAVQPRHLIREIEKIIGETFPKSITLRSNVPRDLWHILADPTQIHQVLLNICLNARDAMPDGGDLIIAAENMELDVAYAKMHPEAKPGPYIIVSITDTGVGISPGTIDKIFDPFFTTKEVGKGTGLGLSTVLSIVKSHGGYVTVYSEPKRGTTFRVHIPAKTTSDIPAVPAADREIPLGHGEKVLVVDDEASVREITRETLESHGYTVTCASDGIEALSHFAKDGAGFDVVITDLMMPLLDGPTTIRGLRRLNPSIKIIAMTGYASREIVANLGGHAVDGHLPKPFTAQKLLNMLSSVLHGDGHPGTPRSRP